MSLRTLTAIIVIILFANCKNEKNVEVTNSSTPKIINQVKNNKNLITDFRAIHKDGDINVVVEIPSGTLEKWEVDKTTGNVALEERKGKPRVVNYLSYPSNYGMIPQTLLSKESGGDNDPLDVIILGKPLKRGSVVKCKLIGVIYLIDKGEQDDKLIAVHENSPFYQLNSLQDLKSNYNGAIEILQLWFTNYKGIGKMDFKGFGEKDKATEILNSAIKGYKKNTTSAK